MIPIIVLTIADGDDREFMTDLYQDYYALMKKTAIRILNTQDEAEDIVNAACVKLIGKISVLRDMNCYALSSYIVLTVKRTAIDFIKHRDVVHKYTYMGGETDAKDMISDVKEGDVSVERFVVDGQFMKEAVEMLWELPEKELFLLQLKYVSQLSDKEIADILDIKPDSVRSYLARARKKALGLLKKGGIQGV